MELGDHCGSDDLYVNDERIPVSREVFQAVCKENNHIRYLARCEKRCMQARYFLCLGDCLLCPWHRRGILRILTVLTIRHFSWISEMWKRK